MDLIRVTKKKNTIRLREIIGERLDLSCDTLSDVIEEIVDEWPEIYAEDN